MILEILKQDRKKGKLLSIKRHNTNIKNHRVDLIYSKRNSLENTFFGILPEIIFNRVFKLSDYEKQVNTENKKYLPIKYKTDFINHENKTIEIKTTNSFKKSFVYFNLDFYKRKKQNNLLSDIIVFCKYSENWKISKSLKILGFLHTRDLNNFPIDKTCLSYAYKIPISKLKKNLDKILKLRRKK